MFFYDSFAGFEMEVERISDQELRFCPGNIFRGQRFNHRLRRDRHHRRGLDDPMRGF